MSGSLLLLLLALLFSADSASAPAHCLSYTCALDAYDASSQVWGPSALRARLHNASNSVVFDAVLRYSANAATLADIGSGAPPFIRLLDWLPSRVIVAPYFVADQGDESNSSHILKAAAAAAARPRGVSFPFDGISIITSPFQRTPKDLNFDMVLCLGVLEHVDKPKEFFRKLLHTARQTLIVSVPYLWPPCGQKGCGHLTDNIDEEVVRDWAGKPWTEFVVVTDGNKPGHNRRAVFVFSNVVPAAAAAAGAGAEEGETSSDNL